MIFVITALFLASRVWSAPLPGIGNVTVSGPGVSDHGKPNLVCFPTSLMDIAIFVFVNYLTHAASARLPHGASTGRTVKVIIDSLCYPVLGIGYALPAIAQWSVGLQKGFPWIVLPKDNLKTAHRAGALITACRNDDWLPNEKDESYEQVTLEENSSGSESSSGSKGGDPPSSNQQEPSTTAATYDCKLSDVSRDEQKRWLRFEPPDEHFNIFGGRELPTGYGWVFVPWDAKIERPTTNAPLPEKSLLKRRWSVYGDQDLELPEMPLGAEYSLFQPIAAVIQAISAGITLYRTRGDQLDRYGFTAFGLTVVPYLVMSIVNFFAHFAVPKYSALYIVQSDILDEATLRQGDKIPRRCVVGRLPSEKPSQERPQVKIKRETRKDGLVVIEIVKSEEAESAEPEDGLPIPGKKMFIPSTPTVIPKETSGGSAKEKAEDKSNDEPNVNVKHEIEQVSTAKPDAGPEPSPTHRIILSRFPSVQFNDDDPGNNVTDSVAKSDKPRAKKRPIGRKTMGALHWAIGLSSLVIIAAVSQMQLGTATKPRWKDIFIVWLVFSCLSAVATHMVLGVSNLLLLGCLWVVRQVYNFIQATFSGVVHKCLDMLRREAKDKRQRLKAIHQKSHDTWWSYTDDVIMFILKFAFFFILLVMVSQQLLDYGDCTYFRP
ncbi:hypothetical protein MFIFM68171_08136 [Madurella fahalii]|uniref:Uncharacterized protein n=1 Tax=Madurella fahalii TaxID=1157608 RepID=A0ABQ0GJI7_9PEZI